MAAFNNNPGGCCCGTATGWFDCWHNKSPEFPDFIERTGSMFPMEPIPDPFGSRHVENWFINPALAAGLQNAGWVIDDGKYLWSIEQVEDGEHEWFACYEGTTEKFRLRYADIPLAHYPWAFPTAEFTHAYPGFGLAVEKAYVSTVWQGAVPFAISEWSETHWPAPDGGEIVTIGDSPDANPNWPPYTGHQYWKSLVCIQQITPAGQVVMWGSLDRYLYTCQAKYIADYVERWDDGTLSGVAWHGYAKAVQMGSNAWPIGAGVEFEMVTQYGLIAPYRDQKNETNVDSKLVFKLSSMESTGDAIQLSEGGVPGDSDAISAIVKEVTYPTSWGWCIPEDRGDGVTIYRFKEMAPAYGQWLWLDVCRGHWVAVLQYASMLISDDDLYGAWNFRPTAFNTQELWVDGHLVDSITMPVGVSGGFGYQRNQYDTATRGVHPYFGHPRMAYPHATLGGGYWMTCREIYTTKPSKDNWYGVSAGYSKIQLYKKDQMLWESPANMPSVASGLVSQYGVDLGPITDNVYGIGYIDSSDAWIYMNIPSHISASELTDGKFNDFGSLSVNTVRWLIRHDGSEIIPIGQLTDDPKVVHPIGNIYRCASVKRVTDSISLPDNFNDMYQQRHM